MKFLHCADLHVGANAYLPDNLERTEKVIHDIFSIARNKKVTTVVIAGDIFHEGNTTKDQRNLIQRLFLGYDAAGFNILVIPGNHDLVSHSGETAIRYLSILYDMGHFKNSVVTERTMYHQIDDTIFLLLVHKQNNFKKDFNKAIEQLKDASVHLSFNNVVVVAHEMIKGAISELKDSKGNNIVLNRGDSLDTYPFITYVALGDIHKYQKMAPRTFYSGSPYQLKFGEEPKKGVLIVNTDNPDTPEFISIQSKQLVVAKSREDISEEHYIKLVTNKLDLNDSDLPDNVVKTDYVKNEIDLAIHIEEGEQLKNNVSQNVFDHIDKNFVKEEAEKIKQTAINEIDNLFLTVE